MNVDKNPGTMTEVNPQLVSFQGVFGNSDLSTHAVSPISSASYHVPSHIHVCSSISSRVCASLHVTFIFLQRSSIHICVHFFISSRALARLNITCVFVACDWPFTYVYILFCISCWILASSLRLPLVFLIILILHLPLRVILSHILMLTPL